VEGIGPDQIEKPVGPYAGLRQATQQFRPVFAGVIICGDHTVPPVHSALLCLRNTPVIAGACTGSARCIIGYPLTVYARIPCPCRSGLAREAVDVVTIIHEYGRKEQKGCSCGKDK
jgi:hypothetical protein